MTANGNGGKSPAKLQARLFGKIVLTLENCLLPEDKLKQTPSQQDGLDRETETDLRILGCELIQTAGILLKLPQVAMATGQVLFQRFFYSKSFVRHSMEVTAMSCICLASKIEEAPRKIRDVINVFHHIKQVRAQKPIVSMILDQNYISLKSQVIKAERRVLKVLGFCVHVKHPHKLIVMYLQVLGYEKHQKLMQMAWNFMNDSFRTDVFVRFHPETIACACIYLTARKLSIPLPNNPAWYTIFKVSEEQIIDISYQISALYRRAKPNVEKLDTAVEELMKKYMESRNKNRITGQNTPPITAPAVPVVPPLPPPPAATTTTSTTTAELGRGAHNAWGGFISRSLPAVPLPTEKESTAVKRSSRSKSRSPRSHSPIEEQKYSRSSNKKTRHRSRTPSKSSKKRSRNYSRSSSGSPHQKREKKSDKKNDRRSPGYDRDRYTNGDRGMDKDSRGDRGRDRDKNRSGEKDRKHDRYSSNSKGSGGGSSNAGGSGYKSSKRRDRSKDRRR